MMMIKLPDIELPDKNIDEGACRLRNTQRF